MNPKTSDGTLCLSERERDGERADMIDEMIITEFQIKVALHDQETQQVKKYHKEAKYTCLLKSGRKEPLPARAATSIIGLRS